MGFTASTTGCVYYITAGLLADAEGANLKVVELFCLLHDTQRLNEERIPYTARGRRSTHRHSEASGSTLQTVKWIS